MLKSRNAFSMIELVFVIVVLGILAAIAVPKFAATRDDAKIAAARATIGAVRSGIVSERQKRLLKGDSTYIGSLGSGFENVLSYPATGWSGSTTTYTTTIVGQTCTFDYNSTSGKFLYNTSNNAVCAPLNF